MVEQNGFKTKIKATTNLRNRWTRGLRGCFYPAAAGECHEDYELTTKLG